MSNIYLLCSITLEELNKVKELQVFDVDQYQYYVPCRVIRAFTNKKKCVLKCQEWNVFPDEILRGDSRMFYFCKTVSL